MNRTDRCGRDRELPSREATCAWFEESRMYYNFAIRAFKNTATTDDFSMK